MTKNSFIQSVVSDTWLRDKVRLDPFLSARIKIFLFYFIVGVVVLIFKGIATDFLLHGHLYKVALSQDGQPVRDAFTLATEYLWIQSIVFLILFAFAVFFITNVVLSPIKKSAEIQKHFVSIVSHELRTPLTVMKNGIEVAMRNPTTLSHAKTIEVLDSTLEEINRITATIQFLFAYSVLKERTQILSLKHVSLTASVKETIVLVQKQYQQHKIQISLTADTVGTINADSTAIQILLFNLIENAVLHTPMGGNVTVTVREQKDEVVLLIEDTGSGIRAEDMPYIFEPFYRGRVQPLTIGSHDRMGLGLSLVKEIGELHKAKIHASSSLNIGTVFTVTFPV